MNEYTISLQEVKKVGIPLYRCTDSYHKDFEKAVNILKSLKLRTTVVDKLMYENLRGAEKGRNFYYLLSIGVCGVFVRTISLDDSLCYVNIDVQVVDLESGAKDGLVNLRFPVATLLNKDNFDNQLFIALLQVLQTRGLKWWSFISNSQAKVSILSYNDSAIGYRFRLVHTKIKPLAGHYVFDMDIETANKLGFKPSECSVAKASLKDGYFIALEESIGQHVIDVSSCITICRELVNLVRC